MVCALKLLIVVEMNGTWGVCLRSSERVREHLHNTTRVGEKI
jgi:hypothetical protein